MEQAVHQALSKLGQDYTDPFSKVFETYVLQLLREAGVAFLDEATFKSKNLRNSPAVEAIVELTGGNVLVEAKMSLFPDDVVLSDSRDVVFRKLRRVREAIVQGWRVTEILAREQPAQRSDGTQARNYLIVITSRQLNICNGEQLKRMFGDDVFDDIAPESRFGRPSQEQWAWLPPKNMFFLSIEELEHLSGCLRQREVSLWSLLSEGAEAQSKPASSVFQFDQMLGEHTKKWTMPSIQLEARDRVEAELMRFFQTK